MACKSPCVHVCVCVCVCVCMCVCFCGLRQTLFDATLLDVLGKDVYDSMHTVVQLDVSDLGCGREKIPLQFTPVMQLAWEVLLDKEA